MQGLLDAWSARDVDRILDHYANDARLDHVGMVLEGKDAIRTMIEPMLAAMDELTLETKALVQEGNQVAALITLRGKYGGDLDVPGFPTLPAEGKTFEMTLAEFARVNDEGKIVEENQIHDNLATLQQLGIAPDQMEQFLQAMESASPS